MEVTTRLEQWQNYGLLTNMSESESETDLLPRRILHQQGFFLSKEGA